jgi:hypothetical protein
LRDEVADFATFAQRRLDRPELVRRDRAAARTPGERARSSAPEVGASNSRLTSKISTPATSQARRAGVDSVSYAFRPSGPEVDDLIAALRTRGGRPGPAGSIVLNDRGEGDARVIVFPGVVAVEGRLQALLTGDEDDHGLAHPAGLPDGAERARAAIAGLLGADLGLGPSELRRLDLAGELQFDDGRDGLALLDAMAGLYAPRRKTVVWRKGAEPQTVYWVTEKTGQVRQRAFD